MSYYEEINRAKIRIRKFWLPKVLNGEEVSIDEILIDLDECQFKVGEKSVIKYIERLSRVELLELKEGVWKK